MKIVCDENCEYRNRNADFCGYCLMKILSERKEKNHGTEFRHEKSDFIGKAGTVWSRYTEKDPGAGSQAHV